MRTSCSGRRSSAAAVIAGAASAILSALAAAACATSPACPCSGAGGGAAGALQATGRPLAPLSFDYDRTRPVDWRDESKVERGDAVVRVGSYASPRGGRVPAFVVEPRDPEAARAGAVFVHWGEGERSELLPDAVALAARGVVSVLLSSPASRPEAMRSPESVTDREQYMQTVIDVRRAIDLLAARGDVATGRVAFVGHSFGAHIGGILAGVDGRPRAYVLVAGVASLTELVQTSPDPQIAAARSSQGFDRYLATMEPLDARNFLPHAKPSAFLFQYAKDDVVVSTREAAAYRSLAPGEASLVFYDGGHEMEDPRAALDRRAWLLGRLGLAPRAAYVVEQPDLLAEGIAYDEGAHALFVGSEYQGKIVRVDAQGAARPFATGLLGVLGVRVDAAHGLLWAATNGEPGTATDPAQRGASVLVALDLTTSAVRARLAVDARGKHLLNDVAVTADGTAYVTDSEGGAVLRARPGASALEAYVPAGTLRYPNGIAATARGVYVADAAGLWRVDDGGAAHALAHGPEIEPRGIDGLYACAGGDVLVGVFNGRRPEKIVRFALDPGGDRIAALRTLYTNDGALPSPTTGALDGTSLFLVANSDTEALSETGLAKGDRPRTTILRLDDACAP